MNSPKIEAIIFYAVQRVAKTEDQKAFLLEENIWQRLKVIVPYILFKLEVRSEKDWGSKGVEEKIF